MNCEKKKTKRPYCLLDILAMLTVAVLAVIAGRQYLSVTPLGLEDSAWGFYLGPAVMVAAGHGFSGADVSSESAFASFLRHERESLAPEDIPSECVSSIQNTYERNHRYLIYTVGLFWRFLGVSWGAIAWVMISFYVILGLLIYGIFRLGMNRIFSLAGAIVVLLSAPTLSVLPLLRDFSKGPWFAAVIFLTGYAIVKPLSRRGYLCFAALLGAVIGIGLGFRQDLQVCLLPAAVVIGVVVQGQTPLGIRRRFAALAAFGMAFAISGGPIILSMAEGVSEAPHNIAAGLGADCEIEMGLKPASYETVNIGNDRVVHATISSYGERVLHAPVPIRFLSQEALDVEKAFIIDLAKTFPADLLSRGYAAPVTLLGGANPHRLLLAPGWWTTANANLSGLARHLKQWGPWYALAAFLAIAWGSARRAWALLFLILFFCGYTTLQYYPRHYFHLAFLPYWFSGFLLERVLRGVWQSIRRKHASKPGARFKAAGRVALFAGSVFLLMAPPLLAARIYQDRQVRALLRAFEDLPVTPVPCVEEHANGFVTFRPNELYMTELPPPTDPNLIRTSYWIAEFEPSFEERCADVRYEARVDVFSTRYTVRRDRTGDEGVTRLYFPVYEMGADSEWESNRFAGIVLEEHRAGGFRGLYRVTDLERFRFLQAWCIPRDPQYLRLHQTVRPPGEPRGSQW